MVQKVHALYFGGKHSFQGTNFHLQFMSCSLWYTMEDISKHAFFELRDTCQSYANKQRMTTYAPEWKIANDRGGGMFSELHGQKAISCQKDANQLYITVLLYWELPLDLWLQCDNPLKHLFGLHTLQFV